MKNRSRIVRLLAVIMIAATPVIASATDTLDNYSISCSGISYTVTTDDVDAYEMHHHIYDVANNNYDIIDNTPDHYVDVSGAGTYSIDITFEYQLSPGSVILIDTFHMHGGDEGYNELLSGEYTCQAVSTSTVPTMSVYGLMLTILGLLLVGTRRLRMSVKRD